MTFSEVKSALATVDTLIFRLENGLLVPEHFHITEVGLIDRHFIDCGGTIRNQKTVNFQLWNAGDYSHRLKPAKLLNILKHSERKLGIEDLEVEVEFQSETIGKYDLDFDGKTFVLKSKQTACLAADACGIPPAQQEAQPSGCIPGSGCC